MKKYKARMFVEHDFPTDDMYEQPCEVTLDGKEIAITYREDGYSREWRGAQDRPGHFILSRVNIPAHTADLTKEQDSTYSGLWSEAGMSGRWSIRIKMPK